jgi:nucleoside-diphosphate-sugar epimerase
MTCALVTGASGFLGSHIVDACLEDGNDVRALVRRSSDLSYLRTLTGSKLHYGDLSSPSALDEATRGVDVVYHSAARVLDYGSRADFEEANVEGTRLLLEASRRNGVGRFVFVSSPSVVADGRDQVDIDESYPYPAQFLNLYSETKAMAEKLVLAANSRGFITCSIRPRAVWGPRDRQGYMPKILGKLLRGEMPDVSGGRSIQASLCYCENAARACLLASKSDAVGGKAYFVTDGESVDMWAFMGRIGGLFGMPPMRRRVNPAVLRAAAALVDAVWMLPSLGHRRPPPLSRYSVSLLTCASTYSIAAARRDFGYVPTVSVEEGLVRLVRWVESIGGVGELVRLAR